MKFLALGIGVAVIALFLRWAFSAISFKVLKSNSEQAQPTATTIRPGKVIVRSLGVAVLWALLVWGGAMILIDTEPSWFFEDEADAERMDRKLAWFLAKWGFLLALLISLTAAVFSRNQKADTP